MWVNLDQSYLIIYVNDAEDTAEITNIYPMASGVHPIRWLQNMLQYCIYMYSHGIKVDLVYRHLLGRIWYEYGLCNQDTSICYLWHLCDVCQGMSLLQQQPFQFELIFWICMPISCYQIIYEKPFKLVAEVLRNRSAVFVFLEHL